MLEIVIWEDKLLHMYRLHIFSLWSYYVTWCGEHAPTGHLCSWNRKILPGNLCYPSIICHMMFFPVLERVILPGDLSLYEEVSHLPSVSGNCPDSFGMRTDEQSLRLSAGYSYCIHGWLGFAANILLARLLVKVNATNIISNLRCKELYSSCVVISSTAGNVLKSYVTHRGHHRFLLFHVTRKQIWNFFLKVFRKLSYLIFNGGASLQDLLCPVKEWHNRWQGSILLSTEI